MDYIGEVISSDLETYGASAHSDYGMVTLLLTDGVPGLQVKHYCNSPLLSSPGVLTHVCENS